jgi:hypothetical protein
MMLALMTLVMKLKDVNTRLSLAMTMINVLMTIAALPMDVNIPL